MSNEGVVIRRATAEDAQACGSICYEAFATINKAHNFPPDIPSAEVGVQLLGALFSHPGFYCVVAEDGGQIVGSNCVDPRATIWGIGPITIAPGAQNRGAGRALMKAVMGRAEEQGAAGVRLLQAAFHNRSLSLYTKLGFDTREPISVMQGPAIGRVPDGLTVRPMKESDLEAA